MGDQRLSSVQMPPDRPTDNATPEHGLATLRRFLPYLWPAGHPALKARVIIALLLVLAAQAATLTMPSGATHSRSHRAPHRRRRSLSNSAPPDDTFTSVTTSPGCTRARGGKRPPANV